MKTKQIIINFGLVASPSFPAVARARVLAEGIKPLGMELQVVAGEVLAALHAIGCKIIHSVIIGRGGEYRVVLKCQYPVEAEQLDCKPPSVLKYYPYMRLYEVAAYFAQDCVAVVPDGEQGLLVGAGADKWGAFDSTKFITLD